MRKKWFIIATAVFLGVVCVVFILDRQSHYAYEEVIAEIEKHGNLYYDIDTIGDVIMFSPLGKKLVSPSILQRVIDWYNYTFDASRKTSTTQIFYIKSGSHDYSTITLLGNNNQICEIVIEPQKEAKQDALNLRSDLSKAFPDLPCKIIPSP
ncbi:MAG: hypothetical protein V4727_13275 [Verrucomicrobiota bacterium]